MPEDTNYLVVAIVRRHPGIGVGHCVDEIQRIHAPISRREALHWVRNARTCGAIYVRRLKNNRRALHVKP